MLNEPKFIKRHLKDPYTSAFRLDCGHIRYPGTNVLHYRDVNEDCYFCDEECLTEYLIKEGIVNFTVETIPHIEKSTDNADA